MIEDFSHLTYWVHDLFVLILLMVTFIGAGMAFYARRYKTAVANIFVWFMVASAEWALTYAFELQSMERGLKLLWAKAEYLGFVTLPVLWLLLALGYTGNVRLLRGRYLTALFVIPLITLSLVFTNEAHHLIWQEVTLSAGAPFPVLIMDYGPWFWVHTAYSFSCVLFGLLLYLYDLIKSTGLQRQRTGIMFFGGLLSFVSTILYVFRLFRFGVRFVDLTPICALITGLMWAYGLFRFRLLDLVPVAYRAILQEMSDGVVVLDTDLRIVEINPAAQRIFGLAHSQAIGKQASEVLPHWSKLTHLVSAIAAQRAEISFEHDGRKHFYDVAVSFLLDARGQPGGQIIVLRDITARKKMEEVMRRRSRELSALYSIAQATSQSLELVEVLDAALEVTMSISGADKGVVFLVEGDHLKLAAHRGMSDHFVRTYPELKMGEHVSGRVALTGEPVIMEDALTDERATPEVVAREKYRSLICLPVKVRDKVVAVIAHLHSQPHHFTQDDLQLLIAASDQIAVAVDNAALYRATAEALTRLRALIDSSYEGIILIAPDLKIQEINNPALKLLGLPGDVKDWVGKSFAEILMALHHTAPAAVKVAIRETRRVQAGDNSPGEGEFETFGHPPRHIRYSNLPVWLEGRILGRLIILRDVTEERLLERMREDLTHMLLHDLRNPLTLIHLALETLHQDLQGTLSSELQSMLDIARTNVNKMTSLINNILDVSRLESGQMPIQPVPVHIPQVAAEVLRIHEPLSQAHGVELVNEVPADLPPAWADPRLTERVLDNLVENAIKYTPSGGRVWVHAQVKGERLLLSVSDTGPGIPPEVKARLFQKFVTGKQAGAGSGLGLAFCRLAVEAQGGHIWAESEAGRGTTFTFSLPLYAGQGQAK